MFYAYSMIQISILEIAIRCLFACCRIMMYKHVYMHHVMHNMCT